jgi:uncharacterized protein YjbI with pentapeptide repeats
MIFVGSDQDLQGQFFKPILKTMVNDVAPQMDDRTTLLALLQAGSAGDRDFYCADLTGISLVGCNLKQGKFLNANLQGADLRQTDLSGADLRGVDLSHANLSGANLENACLSRSLLEGTDFTDANLTGARFQVARYDSQTQWPSEFNYKSLGAIGPYANLNGAFLNTANLRYADLRHANLVGGYLSGTDLTGANLENARLSGATLSHAILVGAYLKNGRLQGADLRHADFRAADLTGVELDHLESIAGSDFYRSQHLSDKLRSYLLSRPSSELDVWNAFSRRTTRESLTLDV